MRLERHTLHLGIRLVREPWERPEMRRTVASEIGGALRLLAFDDPDVDWTDDHVIITATTVAVGADRDVLQLARAAVTAVCEGVKHDPFPIRRPKWIAGRGTTK